MTPFTFTTAGRIVFGRGTAAQAVDLIMPFGTRILLVRGSAVSWVDQLRCDLEGRGCVVSEAVGSGEPDVALVSEVVARGRTANAEVVVAVGGGAVLDLGKAAAALIPAPNDIMHHLESVGAGHPLVARPLPMVAIPTTSGTGAEVTKNAVITVPDASRKVSLRDDRMLPDVALVDPALTDHCPRGVTLASGFDAITQLIEPYLSSRANPMTDALVRAALPAGLRALAQLGRAQDARARDTLAFASVMGGLALANAGLGAVHGLAGVIGGRFGAPHGLICARLLGPVLVQNQQALRAQGADLSRYAEVGNLIAEAFDVSAADSFARLPDLLDQLGMPRLSRWILPSSDLDQTATEAAGASSMKANPVTLGNEALIAAMQGAL